MIRPTRDAALGGVTLALAGAYYSAATAIPESFLSDAVGPQGLPKLYAVILAALSLILIVQGAGGRGKGEAEGRSSSPVPRGLLLRVFGMLMIGVLYVALVPSLGYLISLAALIVATTYYQGGVINRYVAIVGVSGALFLWLLFVQVLGIPQPAGLLPSLF